MRGNERAGIRNNGNHLFNMAAFIGINREINKWRNNKKIMINRYKQKMR